jgi:hypothetical protein
MPLPTVRELDSSSGSLDGNGGACSSRQKGPRKCVRFADVAEYADEKASQSSGVAAESPGSGADDGSDSGRMLAAGSGDEGGAAGAKAHSATSAADSPQNSGHDAVDAKGHGTLPSWRKHFRMPVVEWWAPQRVALQHPISQAVSTPLCIQDVP